MKAKFGSIFRFNNEVFPLSLWVVVKPSIEELKETFEILEDDGVTVSPLTDDRIKEYWSACRITVVHKKTRETGSLIAILIPSKVTMGTITHEVSHAYDDYVQLLNLEATGETRAYLSEWMADKVYGVLRKKVL